MTITTGSISIGPLGLPAPGRVNLDTRARDVADAARLVREASAPRRVKAKIDPAAVYARMNRPRAALPAKRAEQCSAECVAQLDGFAPCTDADSCSALPRDSARAQARRPRTFAELARDCYGGAGWPTQTTHTNGRGNR